MRQVHLLGPDIYEVGYSELADDARVEVIAATLEQTTSQFVGGRLRLRNGEEIQVITVLERRQVVIGRMEVLSVTRCVA